MKKILYSFLFVFFHNVIPSQTTSFQWVGQMGGANVDYMFFATEIDQFSNIYTSGTLPGLGDYDPGPGVFNLSGSAGDGFISKLDASGNFVWAKQLRCRGLCEPFAMGCDNINNIFITGNFSDSLDLNPGISNFYVNSSGNQEAFVLKLDLNGNFVWGTSFQGITASYSTQGYDIGVDALGNTIAIGTFGSIIDFDPGPGTFTLDSGPNGAGYIVKLSATGNLIWADQITSLSGSNIIKSVAIDASNNIIAGGEFSGVADFDPSSATYTLDASAGNMFITKLDQNGNLIWVEQLGGNPSGLVTIWDLKLNPSGDIYIGGDIYSTVDLDPGPGVASFTSTSIDYFIVKLNPTGNYVWAKISGNPNDEEIMTMDVDASGNVYATGIFRGTSDFDPGPGTYTLASALGADNVFNLKLSAAGNFAWANGFVGGGYGLGIGICVDAAGSVFTTGYFNYTFDFDPSPLAQSNLTAFGFEDIFVQKMSQSATSITDKKYSSTSFLFPNPNTGQFNIQTDQNGSLEIFDLTGQIILNEKVGRGVTKINTGAISNGIYLYCFTGEDEQQQKGKLIIE